MKWETTGTCIPILYINMFVTMLAPGINTKNAVPSFDLFLTCREKLAVRCLRKERLGKSTIDIHVSPTGERVGMRPN